MRLTVKTSDKKPVEFTLDLAPTQTVNELVARITEQLQGRGVKKLIVRGKILWEASSKANADVPLAAVGLADGGAIIVMAEKAVKRKQVAAAAAPAAAPSAAPAAAAAPQPAAAPVAARQAPAPAPANAAAAASRDAIAQLIALGIADSERTAAQAMEMAAGNIDQAAELLASGALAGASGAAAAAAPVAAASSEPLGELATHPALRQMRVHVASDPQLLRPLLQQLGQANPDLLAQIAENPGAFVRQLTAPVEPKDRQRFAPHGGVPHGEPAASQQQQQQQQNQIRLTAADEKAIKTLSEYCSGFSREQMVEAYLACGKNTETAATYLYDQAGS
jgi:UV excision repair protein RAD23